MQSSTIIEVDSKLKNMFKQIQIDKTVNHTVLKINYTKFDGPNN